MQKIKNAKGITLISLCITIVVLLILTTTVTISVTNILELNHYNAYKKDFMRLEEAINTYYRKNNRLPILEKYTNIAMLESDKNPNDGPDYYLIDVFSLGDISLNHGQGNYDKNITATDCYIINEQSHTIYYPSGIKLDNKIHYTITDSNSEGNKAENLYQKVNLPLLATVTMESNGINPGYAKNGSVITITMRFNYDLTQEPLVLINEKQATITKDGKNRIATYQIPEDEKTLQEGKIPMSISGYAGNGQVGETLTDVTIGEGVIYDRVAPSSDLSQIEIVSRTDKIAKIKWTLRDTNGGSGIDLKNSKYVVNSSATPMGTNIENWKAMASIENSGAIKMFQTIAKEQYYIHILSVDKAGNVVELIKQF